MVVIGILQLFEKKCGKENIDAIFSLPIKRTNTLVWIVGVTIIKGSNVEMLSWVKMTSFLKVSMNLPQKTKYFAPKCHFQKFFIPTVSKLQTEISKDETLSHAKMGTDKTWVFFKKTATFFNIWKSHNFLIKFLNYHLTCYNKISIGHLF